MATTDVSNAGSGSASGDNLGSAGNGTQGSGSGATETKPKVYSEEHVQELYHENGKHRLKNKELTEKLKNFEDAQAAAEQKRLEEAGEHKKIAEEAEKRAKKVEKEAQEKIATQQRKSIKTALRAELIREGIIDSDDVALLDMSKVTWDDDADEPAGIAALVADFKKLKPAKFKAAADEAGNGGDGGGTGNTKKRADQSTPVGGGNTQRNGIDYNKEDAKTVNEAWNTKYVRP